MSTTHRLKTWPKYFGAMLSGAKRFEVRKNDRGFQVGDVLRLEEWDPATDEYTGAFMLKYVTYVLEGGRFGIESGHCVMGIGDNP